MPPVLTYADQMPAAEQPRQVDPANTHWRIELATRAAVIIDADDYFNAAREAMLDARERIMLVGWDFDARIKLGDASDDAGPETVGEFIYWLVERTPTLHVYLLRWDLGALKTLTRGSTFFTVLKWMRHPRIFTKLDGAHPPAASHHQKIVVIDDIFAFCGGIDMTGARWDTRAHLDADPGRVLPNGKPYEPWHDATTALQGPVAAALGDLCRTRWKRAGGRPMQPVTAAKPIWPKNTRVQFGDISVAIARSSPDMPDEQGIHEIEALYVDHIARAKKWIYAESQYFASRRIAEAMARRLEEDDGPEIIIINPLTAQGWLEPIAMDTARAHLFGALQAHDKHGRFKMFHPHTNSGEPIYVHAKIMIIDDGILRIGSSNLNNRSMRLDTECDIVIDQCYSGNAAQVDEIRRVRTSLLAEHLGSSEDAVERLVTSTGSLISTIEVMRKKTGKLRPYALPEVNDVAAWLAANEILDPEGPTEIFETIGNRGLFRKRWFGRKKTI
jgi:phosphatidylserine/phosphatidylglycerophosphate/cardiolipin synthase-like enzyme